MTISERVFTLLEAQNKKQADLARALGVRQNTVTNWKKANYNPDAGHIEAIAAFLGVSIDYLVTGREPATAFLNQGIIGDSCTHNTITINGNAPRELSEIESELLRICSNLDTRRKTELLTYAYKLEKTEV